MERGHCTPEQRAVCPLRECFRDVHHKYWPKRWYGSEVAKEFRELPENKVVMCRNEHNELHATELPPDRPPQWYMEAKIRLAERAVAEVIEHEVA